MSQHLLEAIQINKERKPLYAQASKNRSLKISRTMIATERLSLLSSYTLDNLAKYWQKRGVPVMVHEFIPMDQTPQFSEGFSDAEGITSELPPLDTKTMQKEIMSIFKQKKYADLSKLVSDHIDSLKKFPKHYCMVRHILESILRGSNLLPYHLDRAKELSVRSPEWFCRYLLFSQISIIHSGSLLDKWAHPIQRDGIPILYQDVPTIPPFPDQY